MTLLDILLPLLWIGAVLAAIRLFIILIRGMML